jgi:predicted HTH domain antitoxin
MKVTIEIPDTMEQTLCDQLGQDLEKAAKESLAIAWYQSEKISIGQVAEMLGLSVYQAEGLMKERHVDSLYSLEDYEKGRATLNRLLKS